MTFIDTLIDIDRYVIAGLSAFDTLAQRSWDDAAMAMRKAGRPDVEIADAAELHKERVTASRGKLHRELWLKTFDALLKMEASIAGGDEKDPPCDGDRSPVEIS